MALKRRIVAGLVPAFLPDQQVYPRQYQGDRYEFPLPFIRTI